MLSFVTSNELFQHLCGGVHILEFIIQEPDLYTVLLPTDWRQFFEYYETPVILDLLMRQDLTLLGSPDNLLKDTCEKLGWRSGPTPPLSLLEYIEDVRRFCLDRTCHRFKAAFPLGSETKLSRHVAVGMNAKKAHEVSKLVAYVDSVASRISLDYSCQISHFVDFGSGQNYLGRALASLPFDKKVIALESKPLNIDGALSMDVTAKLAKKEIVMRNKKQHRRELYGDMHRQKDSSSARSTPSKDKKSPPPLERRSHGQESNIRYVETIIQDGDLDSVLSRINSSIPPSFPLPSIPPSFPLPSTSQISNLMIISLHSCGNLIHHGLRSLILNPSVRAVALVGCCYNLLTERLPPLQGRASSKLRVPNARLTQTSSAADPHGFPMSERFLKYQHPGGSDRGVRFNITARMMAVQAPQNWTQVDCDSFFTKHFYRALFQKILLDRGVVDAPGTVQSGDIKGKRETERKDDEKKEPIILGSLRKSAYTSFLAYVRGAIGKLSASPAHQMLVAQNLVSVTDEEIFSYEQRYAHKKKELSIVWSLMAFSAQVVESAIVVDRWQWLQEQEDVKEAWVESVFEYGISPRNMVVCGVKG
ncbi:MAG: hypothetical protein Q9213_002340 [Squamulea squamosa]